MIDHVVVDVEIQNCVGENGITWEDTDKLGVAVAVIYEYRSDRFRIYGPDDVEALKARLLAAERISSFNGWKFDFPVIWGSPKRCRIWELKDKSNDILRRIWQSLGLDPDTWSDDHKGWTLNAVVSGTLHAGASKIGHGADAPKWFQSGQWARLVNYCVDDVALERDLVNFVNRHGYLINGITGQVVHLKKHYSFFQNQNSVN